MPVVDSLLQISNVVGKVKLDSALLADSIQKADSIARVDSAKTVISNLPSGFEGIAIPSVPSTQSWVFIALVILFFLLVNAFSKAGGDFFENIKYFFSRKGSSTIFDVPNVNVVQFRIYMTIFILSVFSLFIYEVFYISTGGFKLQTFAILFGISVGFYLLKILLFDVVGLVFFDARTVKNYKELYFNLLCLLSITAFPLLILYTFQPAEWLQILEIIALTLIGVFYLLLTLKLFQLFYSKLLATFYIFLYLCTLEILPALILIRVYNLVI